MRGYRRQHVCLIEPVDPPLVLRRADILAPAVVRMRADAVNRDDAIGKVSLKG
jgi:hypothetical protein